MRVTRRDTIRNKVIKERVHTEAVLNYIERQQVKCLVFQYHARHIEEELKETEADTERDEEITSGKFYTQFYTLFKNNDCGCPKDKNHNFVYLLTPELLKEEEEMKKNSSHFICQNAVK